MNKKNLIHIFILSILGFAVLITLFLFQLPHLKNDKIFQISMIINKSDGYLFSNMRLGLEQAANDLNAEIRFLTLSQDNNSQEQIEILNREVLNGADAIIIFPVNPKEINDFIKSQEYICPIVCMQSSINDKIITISPDNEKVGKAIARAVRHSWVGENIILLDNSDFQNGIKTRIDAAQKMFKNWNIPVERIYITNDDFFEIILQNNNATFVTFEPYIGEQIAKYKSKNSININIYSTGLTPNITKYLENGVINSVIVWSDYASGYLATQNAIKLILNKKTTFSYLPFKIINGDNMYEPENEKILFPVIY